ncbi:MAG TPA: PE family protein, partial [Mycobacterium sp.]|nr:PE family protein [Mycobacterium sp.]
ITDLERAYGEFTQGVSFVQLAEQDAAPGLATLQIAENEFVAGVTDVQTGVDAAVAVLRA